MTGLPTFAVKQQLQADRNLTGFVSVEDFDSEDGDVSVVLVCVSTLAGTMNIYVRSTYLFVRSDMLDRQDVKSLARLFDL